MISNSGLNNLVTAVRPVDNKKDQRFEGKRLEINWSVSACIHLPSRKNSFTESPASEHTSLFTGGLFQAGKWITRSSPLRQKESVPSSAVQFAFALLRAAT